MNPETSFLYGYVTGDPARLKRFIQRWEAAGVQAVRALTIQTVALSIQGEEATQKVQRRLLQEALTRVSWLALGHAVAHYEKERRVA